LAGSSGVRSPSPLCGRTRLFADFLFPVTLEMALDPDVSEAFLVDAWTRGTQSGSDSQVPAPIAQCSLEAYARLDKAANLVPPARSD
jgi:hypothetical protein